MLKKLILLLVTSFLLSGCALAPGMKVNTTTMRKPCMPAKNCVQPTLIPIDGCLISRMTEEFPSAEYAYHVGPHDILSIVVWNHPEFTETGDNPRGTELENTQFHQHSTLTTSGYLVGSNGMIYFPLAGNIAVAGKTIEQIRSKLKAALSPYIRDPQIQVRVMGFRSQKVYVLGEVGKPGIISITDMPLSITDAISLAGGLSQDSADPEHIYVFRGPWTNPKVYWLEATSPDALLLSENFQLRANDVVFAMAKRNHAMESWSKSNTANHSNHLVYIGTGE